VQPVQIFVMGDFNHDVPGEPKCHIDTPKFDDVAPHTSVRFPQSDSTTVLSGVCIRSHSWQHLFENSVELEQPSHTHFNVSASLTSRIDRCYVYAPQWTFVRRTVQSCILVPPNILHFRGISDHAPLLVQTSSCERKMQKRRTAHV
jgi:endonuclease/exonuclease/phosphatase family metal-dependent hydrolase